MHQRFDEMPAANNLQAISQSSVYANHLWPPEASQPLMDGAALSTLTLTINLFSIQNPQDCEQIKQLKRSSKLCDLEVSFHMQYVGGHNVKLKIKSEDKEQAKAELQTKCNIEIDKLLKIIEIISSNRSLARLKITILPLKEGKYTIDDGMRDVLSLYAPLKKILIKNNTLLDFEIDLNGFFRGSIAKNVLKRNSKIQKFCMELNQKNFQIFAESCKSILNGIQNSTAETENLEIQFFDISNMPEAIKAKIVGLIPVDLLDEFEIRGADGENTTSCLKSFADHMTSLIKDAKKRVHKQEEREAFEQEERQMRKQEEEQARKEEEMLKIELTIGDIEEVDIDCDQEACSAATSSNNSPAAYPSIEASSSCSIYNDLFFLSNLNEEQIFTENKAISYRSDILRNSGDQQPSTFPAIPFSNVENLSAQQYAVPAFQPTLPTTHQSLPSALELTRAINHQLSSMHSSYIGPALTHSASSASVFNAFITHGPVLLPTSGLSPVLVSTNISTTGQKRTFDTYQFQASSYASNHPRAAALEARREMKKTSDNMPSR